MPRALPEEPDARQNDTELHSILRRDVELVDIDRNRRFCIRGQPAGRHRFFEMFIPRCRVPLCRAGVR